MSISLDFATGRDREHTLSVLDQLYALDAVDDQNAVDAALDAPENIEFALQDAISNAHKAVREAVDKAKKVDAKALADEALKVPNEDALYHVASLHVADAWKAARNLIDGIAQTVPSRVNSYFDALVAQVPDVESAVHHDSFESAVNADQLSEFLTLRDMADRYRGIKDAVDALRRLRVLPDTRNPNEAWAYECKTPSAEWLNGEDDSIDGSGTDHEQLIRELKRGPYVAATDDEASAVLAEFQPVRQKAIDKRAADKVPDREKFVNVPQDASDLIEKTQRSIDQAEQRARAERAGE